MADSNIVQVTAYLREVLDSVNFAMPGVYGDSLGHAVALTIIEGPEFGGGGILWRCAKGETPEGQRWPENSDDYATRKAELYGWDDANYRTGQMLSPESLYGRTTFTPDELTMIYGTGSTPGTSRAPSGYLSDQDKKTPDTVKAAIAHEQGRGFYGYDRRDAENVTETCQAAVDRMILGE